MRQKGAKKRLLQKMLKRVQLGNEKWLHLLYVVA
jgi:hypothetical protein